MPSLVKRYGMQTSYNASQVRSTVYQCNFHPKHLPLGYLLHLEPNDCKVILKKEFPELCITKYKALISQQISQENTHSQLKSVFVG